MKRRENKNGNARADRELRNTFWGIAAGVLLYLILICALKGISFALVVVAAAAIVVTAGAVAVADRLIQ